MAQQAPPPQQVIVKKGGGCMRNALAFGAIIVVGLIAIAVLAPKGNQPTGTTIQPTAVPGQPTFTPSASGMAKIGDTVTVGSWEVTVEKIERSGNLDWSGRGATAVPKGVYALVFATVKNVSNKTDSVKSFDYKLLDSTGAEFDFCSEFACFSYPKQVERDNFGTDIPPRTEGKMLAIFDIAADSKGLVLAIERDTQIALGDLP